ncbi:hypothetical protein QZH41_002824 [Actinostola sp. cb2023]|nr:hypothetical protein QZH41_002824 [Actinostola sp. cb2023]
MKHDSKTPVLARGDVVIIKGEEKDRNQWKLGIIEELIIGRDGILRGAKLRAGRGVLERPVQRLYPLELSCDRGPPEAAQRLNADAPAFRPQRDVLEEDQPPVRKRNCEFGYFPTVNFL